MTQHDKNRCRVHRVYKMTCEQFNGLWAAADGRCQVCLLPEPETSHGRLVIDHDATLGFWAVRGLLCGRCNTDLHRRDDDAERSYRANAWHFRHRPGWPPVAIPEVPVVPIKEAAQMLQQAADAARNAARSAERGDTSGRRAAYNQFRDAARIATKSGMKQNEIVLATGGLWNREKVYYVLHQCGRRVA